MFQRAQSDRYPAIIDMIQTDSPMVANSLIDQVSSMLTSSSPFYRTLLVLRMNCRSRGQEFNPGLVPYFRGD